MTEHFNRHNDIHFLPLRHFLFLIELGNTNDGLPEDAFSITTDLCHGNDESLNIMSHSLFNFKTFPLLRLTYVTETMNL